MIIKLTGKYKQPYNKRRVCKFFFLYSFYISYFFFISVYFVTDVNNKTLSKAPQILKSDIIKKKKIYRIYVSIYKGIKKKLTTLKFIKSHLLLIMNLLSNGFKEKLQMLIVRNPCQDKLNKMIKTIELK